MKKNLLVLLMLYAFNLMCPSSYKALAQSRQSLETALKKVENVYGAKFVYEKNLLDNKVTSYQVRDKGDVPIEKVLKELLYPQGFLFLYVEKNYYTIIKDSRDKTQLQDNTVQSVVNLKDGRRTVYGRVVDEKGIPLPGVSVIPDGTHAGVSTSSDGTYSVTFDPQIQNIRFSFVGMATQIIPATTDKINVTMAIEANGLKEVQILSTGYEKIPKDRATGSFGYINAKEIEKTPSINLMERLQGKIAGVKFDTRNNTIQIRGQNNYGTSGAQGPLIVVDGFPLISEQSGDTQALTKLGNNTTSVSSVISRINPSDIESITFLKDAAAASIWGAKAANGVVVIETKRGSKKATTVNFGSAVSVSAPADLSQLNTMNSAQYIGLEQELFNKGFVTDPASWSTGYYKFNPNQNTSDALEWMFRVNRGTATASQRDSALAKLAGNNNYAQIKKYLLQKAITQQYNISLSGGGDNTTYYVSANFTNDRPVYKSNFSRSYNITSNTSTDFFNKRVTVTTGLNFNSTYSKANLAAATALGKSIYGLRPYDMLVDGNGNNINRYIQFRPNVIDSLTNKGYLPWTYNAIDELNYSNIITKENRVRANAGIKVKVFDWLDVNALGQYQNNISDLSNEDELNSYNTRTLLNTATSSLANGNLVYGIPLGGVLRSTNYSGYDYSFRGLLSAHKIWDNIHQLNVIAGAEIRETNSKSYGQTRYGYDDLTGISQTVNPTTYYQTIYPYQSYIGAADNIITRSKKRYLSYYSNAGYTLLDKYTASASVRFEDYTMLGVSAKDRGKPLYSGGLKWNVKREKFMEPVGVISDLDLRLTLGTGGTIPSTGYNSTVISINGTDYYTGKPYASVSSPQDSQLSWETTRQWNEGIDLGLFNNRLNLTVDVYSKKSFGILYNMPYNATYGWSTLLRNAGTLSSHGVDVTIAGSPVNHKDWGWNSNLTFAYNTNKVTDSRLTQSTSVSIVSSSTPTVGYPTDYLFVYRWAGLDNTGQSQIYDKTGKVISSTISSNAAGLTSADLKYAGRKSPPYFGGWSNDFRYQNFTLNVMMNYYFGAKFLKYSVGNYPTYVGTYLGVIGTQADLANRWEQPGDEAKTNVPGLSGINSNSITRYQYSDALVRSADHIRLTQLSLAYNIPANLLMRTPFKSLSASFSARNLGIIWRKNKDGIDPDYVTTNSYNNLPPAKNFVLGFNASF
ncbi:TonB-linked outer membrane protein, SusC/RagA family [Mucilaginibacter gossypiicola]|uniref:TonB-linked outer membrane protein, SusC/RagA family n=1 Tax=Mucilaginibacter gossypiicola TaxID=551995 RepID=A0A1H8LN07_9SPHI|nr:SusC/RagA family TonB-linked outer membrane protein [Mucilaginibacter gossypiicola]SEO06218.1 TonB-linked outer membrane protein, SusC/RagA family [Mucilaginibacter gossypiicola]